MGFHLVTRKCSMATVTIFPGHFHECAAFKSVESNFDTSFLVISIVSKNYFPNSTTNILKYRLLVILDIVSCANMETSVSYADKENVYVGFSCKVKLWDAYNLVIRYLKLRLVTGRYIYSLSFYTISEKSVGKVSQNSYRHSRGGTEVNNAKLLSRWPA